MRTDIIEYLQKEIFARCGKPENKFGMGCYYHTEAVAKNAEILADKNGADKEVVIIAAWLHDIASITDYSLYEMHDIHGAQIAFDILNKFNYDTMALVQKSIRNHRGSVESDKTTKEELCVADADAISHFDNVPSLLYLAYVTRGMEYDFGKQFVKEKLNRSFSKLSQDSKDFYADKYSTIM